MIDGFGASRRGILAALSGSALLPGSAQVRGGGANAPGAGPTDALTPEAFGARGDGKADDAGAIQRALDAIAASGRMRTLHFAGGATYRCETGLRLDSAFHSLEGDALLDFPGLSGAAITIGSSVTQEFGNSFGRSGAIRGALRVRGPGPTSSSIGLDFVSDRPGTAAQMLLDGVTVGGFGIGVRFGERAYNNAFVKCELLGCGILVDFLPVGEDGGERNSFVACTLHDAPLAVRHRCSSGALHFVSCSFDYTDRLYDVAAGRLAAIECHHEARSWGDGAIRCTGDGGNIQVSGGWIVNQAERWVVRHLVEVGDGAAVKLTDLFANNRVAPAVVEGRPPSWAAGPGRFVMTGTESYNTGNLPLRLHAERSLIADPDFTHGQWEDPVWRLEDGGKPILSRHGEPGDGLRLGRGSGGGLAAVKAGGGNGSAAFALMAVPVRYGDKVMAGCRVRRGAGGSGTAHATPAWARIDGHDPRGVPTVVRSEDLGSFAFDPDGGAGTLVLPVATLRQAAAPEWATHFMLKINMSTRPAGSLIFDNLWCDRY